MTETLCGPSNPLQTIQKHASVDRTLQQDRLAYIQPPSQTFRSAPAHGVGYLDAEFQAFQAGFPLNGGFQEHLSHYEQGPFAAQSNQELPGWASDFQRLNMTDAMFIPVPPSQLRHEAPLHRHVREDWHQEFVLQNNRQLSLPRNESQSYEPNAWHPRSQYQPLTNFNAPASQLSPVAQQKQRQDNTEDIFDEAAFERAFDAAKIEDFHPELYETTTDTSQVESQGMEEDLKTWWASDPLLRPRDGTIDSASSEQLLQSIIAHQQAFSEQSDSENFTDPQQSYQPRIGSDAILEEASKGQEEQHLDHEADELARTAGQLLDNLKYDQSQKFENSTFLALMRQLRDREVRVEGDRVVDVSKVSSVSI